MFILIYVYVVYIYVVKELKTLSHEKSPRQNISPIYKRALTVANNKTFIRTEMSIISTDEIYGFSTVFAYISNTDLKTKANIKKNRQKQAVIYLALNRLVNIKTYKTQSKI